MYPTIKNISYALFLISSLLLAFITTPVWAADSTDLNPQIVNHKTYVCYTTKYSSKTYRSMEWDCAHMDQAHSCNKNDVVIGLFSRTGWVMSKMFWGRLCSYRCAHVEPYCEWK